MGEKNVGQAPRDKSGPKQEREVEGGLLWCGSGSQELKDTARPV